MIEETEEKEKVGVPSCARMVRGPKVEQEEE
jgi:hypothetical protein